MRFDIFVIVMSFLSIALPADACLGRNSEYSIFVEQMVMVVLFLHEYNFLNLTIDPPPDLAIEIDLTSPTQLGAYESLGVPELWRYQQGKLAIFVLVDGHYLESVTSSLFPTLPIDKGFTQILERSSEILMSEARKEFRQWVRKNLAMDT